MEKHQRRKFVDRKATIILAGILVIFTLALSACARVSSLRGNVLSPEWQEDFSILDRKLSDIGESRYFILKPGFKMIFENCLLTQESSQLNPAAIEYKTYCPGIGLVQDQSLVLTSYGN